MRVLLNLVWLIFGGLVTAIGYLVAGIVACLLIVTIPFGIAAFRIAAYALWPFGRTVVEHPHAGLGSAVGNLVWFVIAGWWIALHHIVLGAVLSLTVIGLPLGMAHFKMVPVAMLPLGKEIVPA